jgi:hypothetical protein
MVAVNTQNCSKSHAIEIGRYNFEKVDRFSYLGSLATGYSNVSKEITNHLIAANRSYFGQKKSALVTAAFQGDKNSYILNTYKAITYILRRTMTNNDERRLSIFGRKIVCRLYGPKCEQKQWQKRYNRELNNFTVNQIWLM